MTKMPSTWIGCNILLILVSVTILPRSSGEYSPFEYTNSHILNLPEFRLKQWRTEAMNIKDGIEKLGNFNVKFCRAALINSLVTYMISKV